MSSPAGRPAAVAYHHVDVFSAAAYAGNSVAVIVDPPPLTGAQMALITRELRHFETVFVQSGPARAQATARVFDLDGELDFAGHPVLGAGEERSLAQGRFLGRPSRLAITAYGSPGAVERVTVGGDVASVATGTLLELPAAGKLGELPGCQGHSWLRGPHHEPHGPRPFRVPPAPRVMPEAASDGP